MGIRGKSSMENKNGNFESREIISMFPTFVWQTIIKKEINQTMNRDIVNKLKTLRQTAPEFDQDVSWQSARDLHNLAEFQTLVSLVKETVKSVLAFLKIGYEGFELTGCWANINVVGSTHKMHSHPNNFLSGVSAVP